jgi:DNA-binding CsgD family transcriptional regulator
MSFGHLPAFFDCLHGVHLAIKNQVFDKGQPAGKNDPGDDKKEDAQALREFFDEFKISKREEEVIKQLGEGKTNKEISKALFISLQTVKDHIYRIYQKTDVKNRVQLVNLIQSYKDEKEL